jgi:hypothetical protein
MPTTNLLTQKDEDKGSKQVDEDEDGDGDEGNADEEEHDDEGKKGGAVFSDEEDEILYRTFLQMKAQSELVSLSFSPRVSLTYISLLPLGDAAGN